MVKPVDVDVYLLSLERVPKHLYSQKNIQFLASDEQSRLTKIKCPRRYREYLCGHILARLIISQKLGVSWQKVQLSSNRHGKLYLPATTKPLTFNISHSGEWWVLALAEKGELGIDIESPCNSQLLNEDILPIAQRNFSFQEYNLLNQLPDELKQKNFYRMWTTKEAVLKAIGVGLGSLSLDKVETSIDDEQPREHLLLTGDDTHCLQSEYTYLEKIDCHLAVASNQKLGKININTNSLDELVKIFNCTTSHERSDEFA